ncbi:beta-ketoacyl reductase, partial [Actinophytocola sp.]|uniref:beta-ketoacyl reductase n=1 Tax=Actinophytocola sp. TaxID=1872138 RepID=UPI002EDB0FB6
ATLGGPGQANYAAANTFLDTLAHHRHHHHQPATTLAWGHWQASTELTHHLTKTDHNRLTTTGIHPMPTTTGLHHLDTAIAHTAPQLCPMRFSPTGLSADTAPPILHRLLPATARRGGAGKPNKGALLQQLADLPPGKHHDHVQQVVLTTTAAVLGHSGPHAIQTTSTFKDLGFDSLTAVQLRNQLNHATGLTLPPTLVFDHPTPRALTEHLLTHLRPQQPPNPVDAVLDQLAVLSETVTDTERSRLAERLQALQRFLVDAVPAVSAGQIESASASELFDLIDNELGIR